MYLYVIIHFVRRARLGVCLSPDDGVSGAALPAAGGGFPRGVRGRSLTSGFCPAARPGLPGWSMPPSPGNLDNLKIKFFGAVWCGLVRSGHFHPPLAKAGWIGGALIPFETLPSEK